MAKALHTPTQIIAKGKALALETGLEPSAWEIHKALGGKGNLSRFRKVWENRYVDATQTFPACETALPDETQAKTDAVIEQLRSSMTLIVSEAVSNAQAAHNRQMVLAARDGQNQINLLQQEIEYLNTVLEEREQEINAVSAELSRR
jgi:hypothetical protein